MEEKDNKQQQSQKKRENQARFSKARRIRSTNQKSADFQKLIQDKLRVFQGEGVSAEGKELQNQIFSEALQQHQVSQEDVQYGNNLCDLIQKKREESADGVVYGRNEYIDEIGLPETPKLVFVKGGKNIGKTYGIAKFLEKELAENPSSQIMMVRTTRLEVTNGMAAQLMGEEWPFALQISRQLLLRKPGRLLERGPSKKTNKTGPAKGSRKKWATKIEDGPVDQDVALEAGLKDNNYPDICGYCTYATASGFRSFQGSSYSQLRHVIWDECNDTGQITPQLLSNFITFLLSMERNNKNLRVGLFGNLLRRDDGSAADLILDFFKIPYDCNLKYFKTSKGTPCLYINTGEAGELFDGVDTQNYTDLFGVRHAQDLTSNMPSAPSKVLNRGAFHRAHPVLSFVFEMDEKFFIIYIGSYDFNGLDGVYYCLHIEHFSSVGHYPEYYPVTSSVKAVNCFNSVMYKKPKKIAKMVKKIRKGEKKKQVFYSGDDVRLEGFKIEERLVRTYGKELDGDI